MFKIIIEDLQKTLKSNLPQIRFLLKKNPAIAYKEIGEIGKKVGKKYNVELLVNFPHRGKIEKFDMYGKQDLSFIVNMEKKRFPIERNIIKEKAKETMKIMHPLPRNQNLMSPEEECDDLPQAYYFKQAHNGLFVRQALLCLVKGVSF